MRQLQYIFQGLYLFSVRKQIILFFSRVALQFVHEMQHKAQKNFDASRDRSLPVFGVGVAFVDESAVSRIPSDEFDKAIQDMKSIVSNLAPPDKAFHVVPIESVYSSNGRDRLEELLNAVKDVTGKEDLLQHLRMLSLQKVQLCLFYYSYDCKH